MQIEYYTKQVYGNTLTYLVNSDASEQILALIGQKTISESQMNRFNKLGIEFVRVFEPTK